MHSTESRLVIGPSESRLVTGPSESRLVIGPSESRLVIGPSESRLVIGPSIHCLQACMCALFNPEILQAGAMKGLRSTCGGECNYSTRRLVSSATLEAGQEDED